MPRNETVVFGIILVVLALTGTGLLYASIGVMTADSDSTPNETTTSTPVDTPTETSITNDRETVLVNGENVMNSSYDESDGSLKVQFRVTGDKWRVNIHRSGVPLTTLVPEPHTDSNGNTHPTTSHWNNNSSLPESKSYALIGSRINSGADTESPRDDEYIVTVVLPTVVQENVRFTLVNDDEAVTFFEGQY